MGFPKHKRIPFFVFTKKLNPQALPSPLLSAPHSNRFHYYWQQYHNEEAGSSAIQYFVPGVHKHPSLNTGHYEVLVHHPYSAPQYHNEDPLKTSNRSRVSRQHNKQPLPHPRT